MNKHLLALTVMPLLSLFSLAALAAKPDPDPAARYADSDEGGIPETGVIKKCTAGTLFKNVDPYISGGNPDEFPVVRSETFLVDGKEVELIVTWDFNNSFLYEFGASKAGVMYELGVENNSEKIIYKLPVGAGPVRSDSGLNKLLDGSDAEKANHIDICISPLDNVAPDVSIRVEPSTVVGTTTTVMGEVFIIATVIDESDVNLEITIVNADGIDVTPAFSAPIQSACDPAAPDCIEYASGPWNTTNFPPGNYTITIVATDTSVLPNEFTKELTVAVSPENCLEGLDGVPDNLIGEGGCNLSGYQIVELPNELEGLLDGKTLTQYAVPAHLSAQTAACGIGPNGERYEFVAQDPRVNADGSLIYDVAKGYPGSLDLSTVFDLSGGFYPNGVVLRADTVGAPCLTLIFGDANFSFADFYDPSNGAPLLNSGAYTYAVTQFPESVPGMTTLPEVGDLQPNPALDDFQPDLQFVPQATYQRDNRLILNFIEKEASPFTSDVINPQRKLTPDFSWFFLNTREVCLTLDPDLPYFEAVLQCKIDLALEYFDNLEQALIVAEPNLIEPSLNNLLTDVNKARSMVKVGYWDKAVTDLTSLENQVTGALWTVDDSNDPGMLIMRIKNLFFRIEQLALAESALP